MNISNEQKSKEIARKWYHDKAPDTAYRAALQMANWKDKNPSVETIKKIIVYALTRTNIMLADDLGNGVEWELLIKKALK